MRARIAWILAGVTLVLVVSDIVITAQYDNLLSESAVAVHGFPFVSGAVLGSAVMGAVVVAREERHVIGWLLNLIGVTSAFSLLTEAYGIWVISEGGPGPSSLAGIAGWLSYMFGGQLAIAGLAFMFLLAPDGHFLSRRWRYAAIVTAAGEVLCVAALASLNPLEFDLLSTDVGQVRELMLSVGFLMFGLGLVASVVSMTLRLRSSTGEQRQQLRVIAISAAMVALGVANSAVVQIINGGEQTWAASLPLFVGYFLLPILFATAVLRYRLYDIDLIVNRTVVLAFGTTFAALGYTVLVVVVGRAVDTRAGGIVLSLLATAVVALAFQPLRRGVIRLANRIAYGTRAQPYVALSDFSRRLAETPSPTTLLPAVAEAAGRAVAARRATAALHAPGGAVASSATWDGPGFADGAGSHLVPVRGGGVTLGTIEVLLPPGRSLRASDERLLRALADQAAVAFRNAAMETQLAEQVAELDRTARELSESRARLIEADAIVRRELEAAISRDVLPRLVALPRQLRAARVAVAERAAVNDLDVLVAGTTATLESLRELTRGVFPTQLARVGIEPALRSFLARREGAPALLVDPTASGRRLPARAETAVYFCCVEAVRFGPATIELSIRDAELVLEIGGLGEHAADLQPVVDRASAAGGSLSLTAGRLELRIPVGADEPAFASAGGGGGPGL
jgi:hypothetical protein